MKLLFISIFFVSMGVFLGSNASVEVCIINCVQCKQMFGRYFQGSICGETCVNSHGRLMPDCNIPSTLSNYLKRFH